MPLSDRIHVARGTMRLKRCEHVKVFAKKDIFAGHPFNQGFHQFGEDEMVVAYGTSECKVHRLPDGSLSYPMTPSKYSGRSRTTDGGKTWREDTSYSFKSGGGKNCLSVGAAKAMRDILTKPIDPFNPDHSLYCGADHVYTTHDRGKTWTGPSFLPRDGCKQFWNRPVYMVRSDGVLLTFPTVSRRQGDEGRLFVYASYDGGVTWAFLSIMAQSDDHMYIMPTALQLPGGRIVAAVRIQIAGAWTQIVDSLDGGLTWRNLGQLNDFGMPTQLGRLKDGRLVAVYGYRIAPFGMRARVSEDDEGFRWGPEIILRDDALSDDIGYPRGGVTSDGAMVAMYYYHEKKYPKPPDVDQFHWGTRSVWATRFWA
jgi:hypothetical protein